MTAAFNANIPTMLICISSGLFTIFTIIWNVKRMPEKKDKKTKRLFNCFMFLGLCVLLMLYVLVVLSFKQIINSNYIFIDVAFGLANTFLLYRYFMVWLKTR